MYCARTAFFGMRLRRQPANRLEHLHLLVAHRVRRHLRRRLHRRERQQLQQVILEHVADDARFLVILAALLDADVLRRRDLHVMNPLPIPDRLEDRVREAQHEHVLNGLLAEIVIDAIRLMLGEESEHEIVELLRALETRGRTASR